MTMPRYRRNTCSSPMSRFGLLMDRMSRTTSAAAMNTLLEEIIMAAGNVTSDEMARLEATWSTRYTEVCRTYGLYS